MGEEVGVRPALKPSLDKWGCVCKISLRLAHGFGFRLALHIQISLKFALNIFAAKKKEEKEFHLIMFCF